MYLGFCFFEIGAKVVLQNRMKYSLDLIALFGFPITMRSFHVRMLWLRNQLGKCNFPWVFASLIILSIADRFTFPALPFNIHLTKAKKFT